jgi:hypothetical protein
MSKGTLFVAAVVLPLPSILAEQKHLFPDYFIMREYYKQFVESDVKMISAKLHSNSWV